MKGLRLYKFEKLCSKKSIDLLFIPGNSKGCIEYPLRAVWRINKSADSSLYQHGLVKFLVNVPKKKLRHAVDRVAMRRKVREAYRLNKHILYNSLSLVPDNLVIEIAFVYMSDKKKDYATVENRMVNILNKVSSSILSKYNADN